MEEENFIYNKKNLNSSHCYCINLEKMTIHDLSTAKDSRSPSEEEYKKQNMKENQIIITDNYINRKTKRGRKEKISLPKNQLKCGVCLEISLFSSEDLISCSICKCIFHLSCYTQCEISKLKEKISYSCIRCSHDIKLNKNINNFYCFICGCSNGVLNKNSITNEFYHQICFNLLIEFKGLNAEEIIKDIIRKWRYKNSCRYCGEKLSKYKAVIKCKNTKCKQFYHIPCSIEKGMIFDLKYMKKYYNVNNFSDIPFYCSNHNKKISFLYKDFVLNKINENKQEKKDNILEYNIKFKKNIKKKKNKKKYLFKIIKNNNINTNNNKLQNEEISNNDNDNINNTKENIINEIKENDDEINNKENIDYYEEKNKNNLFNMDFENIIKENNINNKNIFVDDFGQNFQINKFCTDDNYSKENEENSIFYIH